LIELPQRNAHKNDFAIGGGVAKAKTPHRLYRRGVSTGDEY